MLPFLVKIKSKESALQRAIVNYVLSLGLESNVLQCLEMRRNDPCLPTSKMMLKVVSDFSIKVYCVIQLQSFIIGWIENETSCFPIGIPAKEVFLLPLDHLQIDANGILPGHPHYLTIQIHPK